LEKEEVDDDREEEWEGEQGTTAVGESGGEENDGSIDDDNDAIDMDIAMDIDMEVHDEARDEGTLSGTMGEGGSEMLAEEEEREAQPSRESGDSSIEVISEDLETPRLTFARLFWNQIWTRRDDMPSWSASWTRVCCDGILSVWKICSRMASWSGLVRWRFFLLCAERESLSGSYEWEASE